MMVGGKFTTLPVMMYQDVIGMLDFGKGSVIGMIMLIPAIIATVFAITAVVLALVFGTENPMSVISGTGTVGIILAGVIALVFAGTAEIVFASLPGSGRTKKAAPAKAEPAEA